MLTGFVLPGGTATEQLRQAVLAEESGWDGVFVWEAAYGVDAWSLLAAMAARTQRIRLGTLLTPLPWRRPWKMASQVATVDQLPVAARFFRLASAPSILASPIPARRRASAFVPNDSTRESISSGHCGTAG